MPVPNVTHTSTCAAPGAEAELGPGGGVGVVLDEHRHADPVGQRVPQGFVAPGQVR